MTYPVTEIPDIGPDDAERLKEAGIRTTIRLLDAAKGPRERKRLAGDREMSLPEEDERRLVHRSHIRGDPGGVVFGSRPVRPGDEDHEWLR